MVIIRKQNACLYFTEQDFQKWLSKAQNVTCLIVDGIKGTWISKIGHLNFSASQIPSTHIKLTSKDARPTETSHSWESAHLIFKEYTFFFFFATIPQVWRTSTKHKGFYYAKVNMRSFTVGTNRFFEHINISRLQLLLLTTNNNFNCPFSYMMYTSLRKQSRQSPFLYTLYGRKSDQKELVKVRTNYGN